MLKRFFTVLGLVSSFFAFAPIAQAQEGEAPLSHEHDVRTGFTFEGGLMGVQPMNMPNSVGPMVGLHLGLGYNARHYGILADVGAARARDGSLDNYSAANVGARWYILDGAFSPYVGGGVGYTSLWISRAGGGEVVIPAGGRYSGPFEGSGDGADLYAEIGLLAFRTQTAPRLNVGLRADLPLYKLTSDMPTVPSVRYVPVSLMASIAF